MDKKRNTRLIIIIEKGKEEYTKKKMQSVHVQMESFTNDGNWKEKISGIRGIKENGFGCKCYIMGTKPFIRNAKNSFERQYLKAQIVINCESIDVMMKIENIEFPKHSTETTKESKCIIRKTQIKEKIDASKENIFSDDEIAAFFIAKDELNYMQIFPNENEYKMKALIKKTSEYLINPDKAEEIVEYCLKNFS